MPLNIGYAGALAYVFSAPIWVLLVRIWGFPATLEDILVYSLVHGLIALLLATILIYMLKIQARKP